MQGVGGHLSPCCRTTVRGSRPIPDAVYAHGLRLPLSGAPTHDCFSRRTLSMAVEVNGGIFGHTFEAFHVERSGRAAEDWAGQQMSHSIAVALWAPGPAGPYSGRAPERGAFGAAMHAVYLPRHHRLDSHICWHGQSGREVHTRFFVSCAVPGDTRGGVLVAPGPAPAHNETAPDRGFSGAAGRWRERKVPRGTRPGEQRRIGRGSG